MACSVATVTLLTAGLAGCGGHGSNAASSSSSAPAASKSSSAATGSQSTGALAGLTAPQIATKALANLQQASSVHVNGQGRGDGMTVGADMTVVKGKGCAGTFQLARRGGVQMKVIGVDSWMSADRSFWQSFGGGNGMAMNMFTGKWLKLSKSSNLSQLTQLCGLTSSLPTELSQRGSTDLKLGGVTTIRGQQAQELLASDGSRVYVSDSTTPEFLRIVSTASDGGQVDFTDYGAPVQLTPPPAAEVIDGSKYGM